MMYRAMFSMACSVWNKIDNYSFSLRDLKTSRLYLSKNPIQSTVSDIDPKSSSTRPSKIYGLELLSRWQNR